MRCNKCGSIVGDGITVCPICGNSLVQDTNVNQGVTPVEQNAQIQPTIPVQQGVQPVTIEQVNSVQTTVTPGVTIEQVNQPVAPVQQSAAPTYVASSINPMGEVTNKVNIGEVKPLVDLDGAKIGSMAPTEDPTIKQKKKKKKIIIIVTLIVLVLVIGLGVAFYFFEFRSAKTRLENIYKAMTEFTTTLSNDSIEVSSGKYDLDGSLNFDENNYSISVSGNYGNDIVNKRMNYTFDIDSLNINEELLDEDLKLDGYINDSNLYILVENFYENYIYTGIDDSFFDVFAQNDINYMTIINSVKLALMNSLTNMNSSQSITTASINGSSKKVNDIKIVMTPVNERIFNRTFFNIIASNDSLLTELAKLFGSTKDELKAQFKEQASQDVTTEEERLLASYNITVDFYSPVFGTSLSAIKITAVNKESNERYGLEFDPIDDNTEKYIITDNGNKIFEITKKVETTKTTSTKSSTINLSGVYYDETAYKFNVDLKIDGDINAKVEKINVKNAVSYESLSIDDEIAILEKVKKFGKLGVKYNTEITGLILELKMEQLQEDSNTEVVETTE